jgi:hypothetical protein
VAVSFFLLLRYAVLRDLRYPVTAAVLYEY